MARLSTSWLLLGLLSTQPGCPGPVPPATKSPGGLSGPAGRVRVGQILRLARAGVLEEQRLASGERVVVAMVPSARSATSWQRALDTQGNQFRVAPGGRIVADGEPSADREPASVANVAYYFAQALAMLEARHRREGLVMAGEILDLPARDREVQMAQRHLCSLYARLKIRGEVRRRLYQSLVAVTHRKGEMVEVRNHAHRFTLTMPLPWRLMAGPVESLGPESAAMVISLPGDGKGDQGARTNILWTTSKAPDAGEVGSWASARLLATAGSKTSKVALSLRPGGGEALAFRVEPLEYQGRSISSLQVFFQERGLLHHLALLATDGPGVAAGQVGFSNLIESFRPGIGPWPCEEGSPSSPR
ncbi:MAG: hypothetical protein RBU30_01680 [Polyangia bacterium]|nr:hypothetical protein [Polyangia bacterium]